MTKEEVLKKFEDSITEDSQGETEPPRKKEFKPKEFMFSIKKVSEVLKKEDELSTARRLSAGN